MSRRLTPTPRARGAAVAACLALAAALLPPAPAPAMTVGEAISRAMDQNPDVRAVREQIVERRGQVTEARADALPRVDLTLNGYRDRNPGFLNSTFGQSLLHGGGAGNESPIPIEALLPRPETYYESSLSFSQPLFTWGKLSNAIRIAHLGIDEADALLEATRQEVALEVTDACYDLLLAGETVAVYEKSIEVQERYVRQTQDFLDVGDATRLDLLRARAQLAATRPQLLEARNNVVLAGQRLNFLLGRELDADVKIAPVDDPGEPEIPPLDEVVAEAIRNRPDLGRLDLQRKIFDKTVNVFKADGRPRVDLAGFYGFSTIRTEDQFDRNFEAWRVTLTVSVPLFDGLRTRGVVRQWESRRTQKEIEAGKLAQQVRLEARQAVASLATAVEMYRAAARALESAEEEERVTAETYRQDLATSFELLDANRKALVARTSFLKARYDLLRRQAEMKKVMGTPVDELVASGV